MKYKEQILILANRNYKQVNKTKARKLFNEGADILLHPCNMSF